MMNRDVFEEYPIDWKRYSYNEVFSTITDYVANGSFATLKENVTYKNEKDYAVVIRVKDYTSNFKKDFIYVDEHAYNFLKKSKLEPNDIIISNVGAIGTVFKVPDLKQPMTLGPNSILVKTNHHNEFIYQLLKSPLGQKKLLSITSTTAQPKFNKTDFKSIICYLPTLSEQQKIAAILTSVDEAIEKSEQIIEQTETVKKGLMQQLLTKGIGHQNYKQTLIGDVPEEWEVVKFKDICRIVNGQVDPKKSPYSEMLHIGNANIEKFTGRLLACKSAKEEGQISGKYLFDENHILYGKINPHFGKVAFPKFKGLCSADIYPIETDKRLLPSFLKYLLMSSRFISYTTSVSGRTGIPKVNRTDLDAFLIVVPTLEEQNKIVDIIESVETRINYDEEKLSELYKIKQGLMQQLLTGKVRVQINEDEEVPS
ncbi:restriction endonuclease subunit S [Virgibacillus sp. SK37]|uniref:restriction endonuclease subunit S n=1 Tax=Virgibacillus sp. SK37 TaxID=403957 RepID=UPI0004D12616|nr:restriction endonuclease subunit S [Virgibacillus sp. SK37]AIF44980.1 type I restriction endonuclease subunit S [Virgibacillus sp. SK37]